MKVVGSELVDLHDTIGLVHSEIFFCSADFRNDNLCTVLEHLAANVSATDLGVAVTLELLGVIHFCSAKVVSHGLIL